MGVELLTKHHLEFLSLKGVCTGSSESTHVKMPHCWKSHVKAQISKNMGITILFRPRRNKTCFWGFRESETLTSLSSYRD